MKASLGATLAGGCVLGALLAGTSPARAADAERPSWLELDGRLGVLSRELHFQGDRYGTLRSYQLGAAPDAFIRLRWYPGARFDAAALAHIGGTCSFEQVFGVDSKLGDERFATSSGSSSCGPRVRIPWQRHELGIEAEYGRHRFEVDDEGRLLLPSVDYDFMRVGVDVRLRIESAIFGLYAGPRFVWATGELQSQLWFPHLTAGGMDVGFLLGYEISRDLDLLLGFDVRRYFFELRSEPEDSAARRGMVAESAVDLYLTGWAGISWRVPAERN